MTANWACARPLHLRARRLRLAVGFVLLIVVVGTAIGGPSLASSKTTSTARRGQPAISTTSDPGPGREERAGTPQIWHPDGTSWC